MAGPPRLAPPSAGPAPRTDADRRQPVGIREDRDRVFIKGMATETVTCTVCELHAEAVFRVEGMDCNEEVVILERRLKPLVGLEALSADLIGQRLHVELWLEHEEPMGGGSALERRWKLMVACGGSLGAAAV